MRGVTTRYFADLSLRGTLNYPDVPGSLGVLETPDNFMPIGQADRWGPDDQGNVRPRLRVGGRQIEGRFHIVDDEIRPVG